jgi:Flp pilus assembly protein CpaB
VSSRRTAILIGAIAVGIVAVVLIWQYVRGIENNLYAESQPMTVFIAGQDIKRGTAGEAAVSDKSIVQGQVPQKFLPGTAITSVDEVQKKVALFDISPGTIVVRGMFVDQSTTQISFRERLKNKTHVAMSISVDQVHGVGGFLVPGDEVNIMVMGKYENQGANTTLPANGIAPLKPEVSARMLYQKVQILAVGQTQLLSPGEQASAQNGGSAAGASGAGSGLLTVNVPIEAAQLLATFQQEGFYLSLVPKDYQPKAITPLPAVIDVLPGEDPAKLCPYFDTEFDSGCAKAG